MKLSEYIKKNTEILDYDCIIVTEKKNNKTLQLVKPVIIPKPFQPIKGERYYTLGIGENIEELIWKEEYEDVWNKRNRKAFTTREECVLYSQYLMKKCHYSHSFHVRHQNIYMYLNDKKEICFKNAEYCMEGVTYFPTQRIIEDMIDEFGENFIKAWEFGIYN